MPGVRPERFEEGLAVKHCALSLVGEPIMYPEINAFLRLLHQQRISSFLVTNAQFPDEIRYTPSQSASSSRPSTAVIFVLIHRFKAVSFPPKYCMCCLLTMELGM